MSPLIGPQAASNAGNFPMWFRSTRPTRLAKTPRPRQFRPQVDALEDRCLLSAGALDTTFGGTGVVTTSLSRYSDVAWAVLIQPWDGKIVAAGVSGPMSLARYNTNGSLDSTFGSGGIEVSKIGTNSNKQSAALYPATDTTGNARKILEAGAGSLARFNANGSVDTSFGSKGLVSVSATSNIFAVVVQSDGKIVVAGDDKLVRYNPNGKLDTTFGSGGVATVPGMAGGGLLSALSLQPDGKIVTGGVTGSNTWELARYNPGGTLDTTFDAAGTVPGTVTFSFAAGLPGFGPTLAIYSGTGPDTADSGKIEVAGTLQGNPVPPGLNSSEPALARYNADGTPDTTFGQAGQVVTPFPNGAFGVGGMALQADGKIVVAGRSARYGQWGFGLLRYNTNGSLDSSFGSGGLVQTFNISGDSWANDVALQADGRIVVAGRTYNGTSWDFKVGRYLPGPEVGTFTASTATVTSGGSLTLTASNISDGDPSSANPNQYATVTQVAFYAVDTSGNQYLLGYATLSNGTWVFNTTVGLAPGSYTLFAQATDSDGTVGDSAFLPLTVQ
jgi:uncharacterized delta-60 repeat protein